MARWSLEVLSARGRDRERWREYVAALPTSQKDVFFFPEYAALYEEVYHEPALLFRYGDHRDQVLMATARRSVAELPFYRASGCNSLPAYYDLTTPYGYCGPAVYCQDSGVAPELFAGFREALRQYCVANNIVAEFLRLHPLMQNHRLFGQDPGLYQKNCTVWIDLGCSEAEIFQGMGKNHRNGVRRATSKGVEVVLSDLRAEHLREFYRLYTARMETLGALPVFFLPLEFFQELAAGLPEHVSLFLAQWKGKVVSAYLLLHCGPYVHHFLSGSDSACWDLKANVLTVYQAVLWAKGRGHRFYHLGGGHAVQMDTVFQFKSQFSANRAPYYMYRSVHDAEAYQLLCRMKQEFDQQEAVGRIEAPPQDPLLADYFPAYRR